MANPSGGLVGPGNSMWFHNLMLKLFGTVGHDYKKLIKNYTCLHDASGFLIKHLKIGPGYIYGLFSERLIGVLSAGRPCGFIDLFFSSQCWLGQLTGLRETQNLMTNVNVVRLFKDKMPQTCLKNAFFFEEEEKNGGLGQEWQW